MVSEHDAFHRCLLSLRLEYEKVTAENMQLRRQLEKDPAAPRTEIRASKRMDDALRKSGCDEDFHFTPTVVQTVQRKSFQSVEAPLELPGAVVEKLPVGPPPGLQNSEDGTNEPDEPEEHNGDVGHRKTHRKSVVTVEDELGDSASFLLLLDMVPAAVIILSAAIAGLSADIAPNHIAWTVLEIVFTVFFVAEIIVKCRYFGICEYLVGADWYWSWFDILCVILALVDMTLQFAFSDAEGGDDGSPVGVLKMLKLARLGRIVRLLRFKIFQELKLMIQGVFTGLRVLFWAVVLLLLCMYLLGVFTRTIFSDHAEFETVPAAMFTSFRCFTEGCSAFDGTPLQERLRKDHGGVFMFGYILLFLFVTIGIFNLIMAVFIDNVADGSTKKRQRELGENAPRTEWVLASSLRQIIMTNVLRKETQHLPDDERTQVLKEKIEALRERYGYKPHSNQEYQELADGIREDMSESGVVVTREDFNGWLTSEKELISKMDDAEIDLSCKYDLFDVLDADLSGELDFDEMVDGLIKCRGPVSKTDIIAIRLKTVLLVRMMNGICEKLGIQPG
ncbi:unnamed protein product [Effrenium voratum]|nr:unnamed protein product [Effrenium voratum]CAJ1414809.1 unnamed protein product [Effrenium voratum]